MDRGIQKAAKGKMAGSRLATGAAELTPASEANRTLPLRRDGWILALFLVLTCVMTNPLVLHIASAVEDKQDALLNTWIIAWVGHGLVADPLSLFNANIFYPYSDTLAFSETMLPQGLFALPFNLAFENTVFGYNLVLLASLFLAAYSMYLLVLDLGRYKPAAIVAGIIFAFNPYNLGNLAQVQLLSFGWMPLVLMYLRRMLLSSTSEKQGFSLSLSRDQFLFILCFSVQALSSFYYAFLEGFAVVLYVAWALIAHLRWEVASYISQLARLAVSAIILMLLLTPFFLPYLAVQREMGFERKIAESEPFSASLKLYTEVSPQNVLYGGLLAPRPPVKLGGYALDNLFPGIVAVVLGIVGIIAARERERWFYALLLVFAFWLSLGPRLYISSTAGTEITLPYRWLYDAFPLMRAFRAPVRFDALVMFALAVLAGMGVVRLVATRWRAVVIGSLVAVEYLALPAASITPVPAGDSIPSYVRWLQQRANTTILELPMIASDDTKPLDLTTQYLSTYHWDRTPDGYSGFNPPKRGELAYEMQFFPNGRSIVLLQALGVEYVVLHGDQLRDWDSRHKALGQFADLRYEMQIGDDYIYRVMPRPQDPSLLSASIYTPRPAGPNQSYFAYLIVRNRGPGGYAFKPTDQLQIEARWSENFRQRQFVSPPLVTWNAAVIQVRLVAPPQPGMYQLRLQITGGGIGEWRLASTVDVQGGEPAHQVVLPASVTAAGPLDAQYVPGQTFPVDVYWQPLNKIDAYYSASVRIVDTQGNKIFSQDREPSVATLLWTPGVALQDRFWMTLPKDTAPGDYTVQVLMYQANQGIDALLLTDQFTPIETVELGSFKVK